MTSSLWRLVEVLDIPALGIISQHPHYPDEKFDPVPCRYFIRSLGFDEIILRDDRGDEHLFRFEAFHNTHDLLTLLAYLKPRSVSVPVAGAA